MNTKLIHLVNEIFNWNLEARAELQHGELDELEKWVEADQKIVDQAVKHLQIKMARAKAYELPGLTPSLDRLLARARRLEALDEAIERERDQRMHRADKAVEQSMATCTMTHKFVCGRASVSEPDPAA